MANVNVSVGGVTFGLDEFHPAIASAITGMKRDPETVKLAMLAEINEFSRSNEGTAAVKETGGNAKAVWKDGTKGATVTVSGAAGRKVKMPATGASTLLALNERLESVREMFCRVADCELPSGLRQWIRTAAPEVEAAAAEAPVETSK